MDEFDNFKAIVDRDKQFGGIVLRITHNGYQWSTIMLKNEAEIKAIVDALQAFLVKIEPSGG